MCAIYDQSMQNAATVLDFLNNSQSVGYRHKRSALGPFYSMVRPYLEVCSEENKFDSIKTFYNAWLAEKLFEVCSESCFLFT